MLDARKYSFSQRTVNEWNKFSADCVHSSSINLYVYEQIHISCKGWILVKSCLWQSTDGSLCVACRKTSVPKVEPTVQTDNGELDPYAYNLSRLPIYTVRTHPGKPGKNCNFE